MDLSGEIVAILNSIVLNSYYGTPWGQIQPKKFKMAAVSQVDSKAWPYQSSGNNHLQTVWSDFGSDIFNLRDIKASGFYWGAQSLGSIASRSSEKERPRGEERWPDGLERTAEMKPTESSPSWRGKRLSFWRQTHNNFTRDAIYLNCSRIFVSNRTV